MSSNKRSSIMPAASQAGPKAPVHFSSSITIHDSAILSGMYPITISSESVVHPRARLESEGGPVNIGRRCIVQERVLLGAGGNRAEGSVTLGDYVTVEAAANIECGGTMVGEGTVVGVGCKIGSGAFIGKYCTLTPRSVIAPKERIPDGTVVYSNGMRRLDKRGIVDLRKEAQVRQIEALRRLIPSTPAKFQ
ncbi:hypothetical protein MCOR29_004826 [Pyricularia oryzae]|nr:hypothetical protein MCOR29_004826 [Pyricularia oryzae]KAI6429758.1 hypothetical protein MCOR21_004907 [Pyricularia oryzae]KAI6519840.1 hypothetical protein MCOR10_006520 [Pyricularia oryzae]KAI6531479.1 hypothetical protein MCOR05_007373 [Pyricularia oryzae]